MEWAAVWLYGENLTLEYADEPLSRYKVRYQPDRKRLLDVDEEQLYDTPHRSPQLLLWELAAGEWLKVIRLPEDEPPGYGRPGRPAGLIASGLHRIAPSCGLVPASRPVCVRYVGSSAY